MLAQSQYDYYEGSNSYGGINTAITGFKIFGIIILIIVVILVVGTIYGFLLVGLKKRKIKIIVTNKIIRIKS